MGKTNKNSGIKSSFLKLKKYIYIYSPWVWMSGVPIASTFCSDLRHHLGAGKSLQFVKTVVVN